MIKFCSFIFITLCFLSSIVYSQTKEEGDRLNRDKFVNTKITNNNDIVVLLFIQPIDCQKCVDGFGYTLSCMEKDFQLKPFAMIEGQRDAALKVFKRKYQWKYNQMLDDSDMRSRLGLHHTTRVAFISNKGAVLSELDADQFLDLTCAQISSMLKAKLKTLK